MNEIAAKKEFKKLAQMGYGARGVVYLIVGTLALLAALGEGGGTTDSKGAIIEILHQPFGNMLLVLLIIGLFGYVAWRFVQAVKDPDGHGTSGKALVVRGGLLMSSIAHASLAIWAIRLLLGDESGSSESEGHWLLTTTAGQIALAVAGVAAIGVGLAHMYKGWTARFERYMNLPADKKRWARPVCQFGLAARGVVWCIVGWFLIRSSLMAGSGDVKGMADALASLRDNAYGPWLLGIVAAGLFAFGVYSTLEAFYRRINMS